LTTGQTRIPANAICCPGGRDVTLLWYYRFQSPKSLDCLGKSTLWDRCSVPEGGTALAASKYDKFWTRRYRVRLWIHERIRWLDFVDLLLASIAGFISVVGKPDPAKELLYIYLAIFVGKMAYSIKTRETSSSQRADIATGLLAFINRELFQDSAATRLTIFRRAPFRPTHIIPWTRFRVGGDGGRKEAYKSRARWIKGEGITGRVWQKPSLDLAIQIIPQVPKGERNLLRVLYEGRYGVSPETFQALSDYMSDVRCIISYAFLDERKQFLNLLSVDITAEVEFKREPGSSKFYLEIREDGKTIQVDPQSLWRLVTMVGSVLRSFQTNMKEGER
jgi:hypothetical protein